MGAIAPAGFCTFAVGAVYDRATFSSEWAKCAVIDRAYSGFARSGAAATRRETQPTVQFWTLLTFLDAVRKCKYLR